MFSMSAIQHEQSETHKKSTWINGISLKSDAYGIVKKVKKKEIIKYLHRL